MMKRLKIVGLLSIAALGLAIFAGAGSAQATVLCTKADTPECTISYVIGATVNLSLKSATTSRLTSEGSTIATCTGSNMKGKTQNTNGTTVSILLEELIWTGCSQTTDTIKLGSIAIQGTEGTYNGAVSGSSSEVTTTISGATCTYGFGSVTHLGTIASGSEPVLDIEATLSKKAGGSTCPTAPTWEAEYTLTEPHALYVIQVVPTTVGGTLCTETGTPSCTASYATGTAVDLSLKSGSSMQLTNGGSTIATCTGGTIYGEVGTEASSAAGIGISEFAWSSCFQMTETIANGSLELQWIPGTHNGTVIGKNTEWKFEIFGVKCTYGFGASTDLGMLVGGEEPVLNISASIVKAAGSFLCPSNPVFDADFIVTSPHALYLDEEHIGTGGILCTEALTPECTRSFSKGRPIDLSLKSGSSMRLTNAGSTIATCTGGTIKGSVGTESTNTVAINVSESTWRTCSQTTDTISAGLLEIKHVEGTHNGTVTGKSTAWTFEIFGVSCTYGFGEGTHIGTLLSGETPMLNISTTVPRTAGGFLCPSTVGFDAEYVVTEPHALYVI